MKFYRIFLLLFLLPLAAQASPKVAFFRWEENIDLTKSGRNAEVLMLGKVRDLPQNMVLKSFSIDFGQGRDVKITKVLCDNKQIAYSYQNDILTVKFPQPKGDSDLLSLYFSYEEKYDKINKYLRQETIDIPEFAAGANAQVTIKFPGDMESATLNPNLTKSGNSFIYRAIAPQNGVREIVKLTAAESAWDVSVKVKVSAKKPLDQVTVTIPTYFQSGRQKIDNFTTLTSVRPLDQSTKNKNKIFKFATTENEIIIENKAKILTGAKYRGAVERNPNDYMKISPEEVILLSPVLAQIKRDTRYGNLPLYARIGKYVHDFIKYDESYMGKLPSPKEILINPIGVCTEYANLYNSLARAAQIPSVMVDGAACEYDDCKGHAWNMIFYNGQWMDVDPTWDLMSGIVSSSHIYFHDSDKVSNALVQSYGNDSINFKMDFEMKNSPSN